MSTKEIKVNDAGFKDEVIESKLPVLVDFWATWCAPCATVAPAVSAIADAYEGKLKVCKVDIDEAPDAASRNNVMSIPTLALFKGGKEADRIVGAVPRQAIEGMIRAHL